MNKIFLLKLALVCVSLTVITIIIGRYLGIRPQDIKQWVDSFGIFAPLAYAFILFLGLSVPFNPISDFLVVNIAALLFPPHVSVIFTFIAHVCSLSVNYYLAHKYGRKIIGKITSEDKINSIIQFSSKLTYTRLFFLRFVLPTSNIIGNDILSYLSGIQKMHFPRFFIFSIIPWTILNVLYFYSTTFLLKNHKLFLFIPFLLVIAAPTAYIIVKKDKKKT